MAPSSLQKRIPGKLGSEDAVLGEGARKQMPGSLVCKVDRYILLVAHWAWANRKEP